VVSGIAAPEGPAPWISVTFTDVSTNKVKMDIASHLVQSEFMSELAFNVVGIDIEDVSIDTPVKYGTFTLPTISIPSKPVLGKTYDVEMSFESRNNKQVNRFDQNDIVSYTISYDGPGVMTSQSFNSNNVAHIQSIGCNEDSAWITNIPEPSSATIGALGMFFLIRRRR
jgi:hypothetical protein